MMLPLDQNISDLLDVNTFNPKNFQVLGWVDVNQRWENIDSNRIPDVNNTSYLDGYDSNWFWWKNGGNGPATGNWNVGDNNITDLDSVVFTDNVLIGRGNSAAGTGNLMPCINCSSSQNNNITFGRDLTNDGINTLLGGIESSANGLCENSIVFLHGTGICASPYAVGGGYSASFTSADAPTCWGESIDCSGIQVSCLGAFMDCGGNEASGVGVSSNLSGLRTGNLGAQNNVSHDYANTIGYKCKSTDTNGLFICNKVTAGWDFNAFGENGFCVSDQNCWGSGKIVTEPDLNVGYVTMGTTQTVPAEKTWDASQTFSEGIAIAINKVINFATGSVTMGYDGTNFVIFDGLGNQMIYFDGFAEEPVKFELGIQLLDDILALFGTDGDIELSFDSATGNLELSRGTGSPDFNINMPLMVTDGLSEFSMFGKNPDSIAPGDGKDTLVAVMSSAATTLIHRAFLAVSEFTGTDNSSGQYAGANTFGVTTSDSTGNLTSVSGAGGLFGNYGAARHFGSGDVALASGLAGQAATLGANPGDMDRGIAVNAIGNIVGNGSTMPVSANFYGKDSSSLGTGNIPDNLGHFQEEMTNGSNSNVEFGVEGGGIYGLRVAVGAQPTEYLTSDANGVSNLYASSWNDLNANTRIDGTLSISDKFVFGTDGNFTIRAYDTGATLNCGASAAEERIICK